MKFILFGTDYLENCLEILIPHFTWEYLVFLLLIYLSKRVCSFILSTPQSLPLFVLRLFKVFRLLKALIINMHPIEYYRRYRTKTSISSCWQVEVIQRVSPAGAVKLSRRYSARQLSSPPRTIARYNTQVCSYRGVNFIENRENIRCELIIISFCQL